MKTTPNPVLHRIRLRRGVKSTLGAGKRRVAQVAGLALLVLGMAKPSEVVWLKPGELRATAVERDGTPIPGVTVELMTGEAGRAQRVAITDPKGNAGFDQVASGEYVLKFQLSGSATCSIGPFAMRATANENPELPAFVVLMNPVRVF